MGPNIPSTAAARIDAYLSRLVPFGFWGGALVAHAGEVLLADGYGLASVAADRPNTRDTVFSLSSITKPFTAAAVLDLQDLGTLAVDHPIGRYLPEVPDDKARVTLHHLLTHTGGLIDYIGRDDDRDITRDDAIRVALEAPLRFEPGSRYEYSNAGFTLLAAIVELVADEPYEHVLRRRLLDPAGMDATGYRLPDWSGRPLAHHHVDDVDGGTVLDRHYPSWTLMGSGEMLSTLDDMHRWHRALADGAVLSLEARALMTRPYLEDYAYGWLVQDSEQGCFASHGGATTTGSCADFRRYLDHDTVLVLYCNRLEGGDFQAGRLMDDVAALLFGHEVPMPPAVPSASERQLARHAGARRLAGGGRVEIARRRDHVRVRPLDTRGAAAMHGLDLEVAEAYARRTLEVLEAAGRGDMEPFLRARASERPPEGALEQIRRFVQAADGEPVRVLSTQPSGFVPGAVDVIAGTGDGRVAMVVVWKDGRSEGVGLMPAGGIGMARVPCVPTGGDELVGFSIWSGRELRVRLAPSSGLAVMLVV